MSWLFSRALAAEFSVANCSDGERSAPSSATPTRPAFFWRDRTTEFWNRFPSGMTLGHLTGSLGKELLTWYLEVFLARTSVAQAKAQESTVSGAGCGGSSLGSLARYDRATHSLRTAQCLLFEEGTELLRILPRWGSMRNGELFPLPTPERLTGESGSGLWGTPRSGMARGGNFYYDRGKGNLEEQVGAAETARAMWPTPRASEGAKQPNDANRDSPCLSWVVKNPQLWPTPTVQDSKNDANPSSMERNFFALHAAVKVWSTPTARDANSLAKVSRGNGSKEKGNELVEPLPVQVGGSLNPTWVEWLMGWPLGWTSLDALAMDRFQQWLRLHGEFSEDHE